jgi:hypothetical protein
VPCRVGERGPQIRELQGNGGYFALACLEFSVCGEEGGRNSIRFLFVHESSTAIQLVASKPANFTDLWAFHFSTWVDFSRKRN